MSELDFDRDGAALYSSAALCVMPCIEDAVAGVLNDRAGTRLVDRPALATIFESAPIATIVAKLLCGARPVRAILFDKTPLTNWTLGWHQDRTVAVRRKCDMAGFGPWSVKAGIVHVEPPFAIIEHSVTLRIHLDDVPADNAPLLIAPGSHRLGRIAQADIPATVAQCGTYACLARRGDLWAYATPILHASGPSIGSAHRRVLQIDFSAATLPAGLEWLGLG